MSHDEELVTAIERAARALGVWSGDRAKECIGVDGRYALARATNGRYMGACDEQPDTASYFDAITAALFLLCHAATKTRVTCPTCEGTTHAIDEGPFIDPVLGQRAYKYIPLHQPARGWIMRSQADLLLGALPENSSVDARNALSVLSDDLIANGRCKSSCSICNGAGCMTEAGHLRADTERLERLYPSANGWTIRSTDDGWQAKRTCPRTQQKQALGEWLALWLASLPSIDANASQANPDAPDCRFALAACTPSIIAALDNL